MTAARPLHRQLYEEMVRRIRSGQWAEGEKVPSEKELIDEFGTSRGPVRQALAAMRTEGLIVGTRGAPPRVQRTVPSQPFETFISFTEWAHSLGRAPGQRVIEASRLPANEEDAIALGTQENEPVVHIVRLRLLDGEATLLERSRYRLHPAGRILLAADLDNESMYQSLAAYGLAPVRARHMIDAVAADALDAEHLGVAPAAPLLRVRRTGYDRHGELLEVADDRYLPQMATFVIENAAAHRNPISRETSLTSSPRS